MPHERKSGRARRGSARGNPLLHAVVGGDAGDLDGLVQRARQHQLPVLRLDAAVADRLRVHRRQQLL
eukprot:2485123-Rhodomonas_salina.5